MVTHNGVFYGRMIFFSRGYMHGFRYFTQGMIITTSPYEHGKMVFKVEGSLISVFLLLCAMDSESLRGVMYC